MRCKNCGWPNKPNERECVKCHAPLVGGDDSPSYGGGSPVADNYGPANQSLNKTVREDVVFGGGSPVADNYGQANQPYADQQPSVQRTVPAEETKPCPKCGYPVRPDADKCPNCKFEINKASAGSASSYSSNDSDNFATRQQTVRRPTRVVGGGSSSGSGSGFGKHGGTVNPYMMNFEPEPTFVLQPLKRMNERHELEEIEYEGKEVLLNRENTEENNPSITSREQAVITRVDGHWFIEDRSEQKTTFVQAAKKIELHEGDIILLGNRLFEFHE